MNSRNMLKVGVCALVLGGVSAAGVATHSLTLSAFAASGPNAKKAASEAKDARKALDKRKAGDAVKHAEAAVANDPTNADYRALLGQAYLLSGRFASATQALNDALTLNPEDGRVALNLALAKIAGGDWAGARSTLQTHADHIPASDRGLAFALAGDPVTAVQILDPAARAPDANAKTRQNLALSLALAGRWAEAKEIAAIDVAPGQLDARIMQWAAFSRPTNAYDQVASLLNVKAVEDSGQPVALALSLQPNVAVAAVAAQVRAADPVDAYLPVNPESTAATAIEPDAQVASIDEVAGTGPRVVFAPSREIVQAIPASYRAPATRQASAPTRAAPQRVADAAPTPGRYYVQLGAYANAGVAKDAWARHTSRVPALSESTPQGSSIKTRAGRFYRLSVGGFARNDADALCRQVKSSGGACFVRAGAGEQTAAWAAKGSTQVASR